MVAAILILSIIKTADRFTGTQARAAIEARDADRRAIWRELCTIKPDCDQTPEPIAPAE